jgi:glycerol-3-phosphate acyltransferase PlsY
LSATVFFVPLAVFLTVLAVTKIVSLSSVISACTAAVYLWLMGAGTAVVSTAAICAGLIALRYSGNIRRMIGGTERKISWMG